MKGEGTREGETHFNNFLNHIRVRHSQTLQIFVVSRFPYFTKNRRRDRIINKSLMVSCRHLNPPKHDHRIIRRIF